MERWMELVGLLNDSPITTRAVATNLLTAIEKGRWSKEERPKVDAVYDELNSLLQKWRNDDRRLEEGE